MNYKNLKYKSYEGTVVLRSDWKFEGEVIGLTKNRKYFGKDFNELEAQFKNKVDYFHEQCAMLGVEPEPLRKRQSPKLPYLVLFFSAIFSMSLLWWVYTNEFPLPNVVSEVKVKADWYDKSSSFFNNFSAPILSFFSFIGLLFTIYQQNRSHRLSLKELSLTREELELTRKEFAKTTIANEKQANALDQQVKEAKSAAEEQRTLATEQRLATQIQQFESSFYALLSEHNKALGELVNRTDSTDDDAYIQVKDLFEMSFRQVTEKIDRNVQLCRYFRMLYQLLKFIATNHVDNGKRDFSNEYLRCPALEQEKRYASLVRSMLPQNILGYLAVNSCIGFEPTHAYHKYFLLIHRYAFLEHLNVDGELTFKPKVELLNDGRSIYLNAMSNVLKSYKGEAFGSNDTIERLDSRLMSMINDKHQVCVAIGLGTPESVYYVLMEKHLPIDSPLWSP
jgi:hypothetical protein